MPPKSYMMTAVVLVILIIVSFPITLGFSILVWYWLFEVAACVLGVAGAFRVTLGLGAPLWIAFALASPCIVWAVTKLYEFPFRLSLGSMITFHVLQLIALFAAGAGALRLIDLMSRPHVAFRIAYGILAAAAFVAVFGTIGHVLSWRWTDNRLYFSASQSLSALATLIKYGAFSGAAMLLTLRANLERWTGYSISLISAVMLYESLRPLFVMDRFGSGDAMFWSQPIFMLIGAAALWRMGSLISRPSIPAMPLSMA